MNESVLHDNIQAATILSSIFSSAYGPKGMNKLLVDNIGDTFVTKDGAFITDNIEIKHPIAKLIAEAGETMQEEVGDGSKQAIILTGELLKKAGELVSEGMHPMMIVKGYQQALNKALRVLGEESTKKDGKHVIKNLVKTALLNNEFLANAVLDAVKGASVDDVLILKKPGQAVNTTVINGVVIDKERVHSSMPDKVLDARILITKTPLEVRGTVTNSEFEIESPNQLRRLLQEEHESIKQLVKFISDSGVNVVLCQKGISDQAQEYLAKKGILAVRRVREKDINALLKATGAELISDLTSIKKDALGTGSVYTKRVGDERLTFINDCPGKVKTILVRGATEQVTSELEKSINNALGVVKAFTREGAFIPGAGVIEHLISRGLKKNLPSGKEQLAYLGFAESLNKLVKVLINNSGQKIVDLMPRINRDRGVNPNGGLLNPLKKGVIEPVLLKRQAITTATETAIMILRIDEIIKGK